MSDKIMLNISTDGITQYLGQMLSRSNLVSGWLNRVAYPTIINAQRTRWMTENASEGGAWQALNPKYVARKLKKFVDYPGGGRKMLIATNRLVNSVTGDQKTEHYKLVTNTTLEVGTLVPYAKYVNDKRNFTDLSDKTIEDLATKLRGYILRGE